MGGDDGREATEAALRLCDTWRDSDSGCAFSRDRTLLVYGTDGTAARLTEPQLRAVLARSTELEAQCAQLEQQRDEARYQLCGAQARIDYFESRAGAVRTTALLESEVARLKGELEAARDDIPACCSAVEMVEHDEDCKTHTHGGSS